jgi:biotin-dependent carboxylase-like uncharacterized protein
MTVGFRVLGAGIASSIQDRGRVGFAHLGLGRSGVIDQSSAEALNRCLGNPAAAPVLETAGGIVLECVTRCLVAMSGWTAPRLVIEGERLVVSAVNGRQWAYLAVAGGFTGDEILGSLSADTMAGIAPVNLSVGAELDIGGLVDGSPSDLIAPLASRSNILLLPGPHLDRLPDTALASLASTEWVVENNSRVGVRLTGRALELPAQSANGQSEPMIVGALQIPPNGCPIILGRDHPVTGGYPVAAVIDDSGISEALGASVGSVLRFHLR